MRIFFSYGAIREIEEATHTERGIVAPTFARHLYSRANVRLKAGAT